MRVGFNKNRPCVHNMAAGELADWRETLSKSLLAEIWPNEFHNVVHNLANGIPLSRDLRILTQLGELQI